MKKVIYLLFLLLLINYVLPYTVFLNVKSFSGLFLFWSLLTIIVALVVIMGISRWWGK